MDIETAVNYTLRALTFDERPLARSFFSDQQTGKHQKKVTCPCCSPSLELQKLTEKQVCIRAPKLVLSEALSQARALAKATGFAAKFILLYCDTLVTQNDVVVQETTTDGTNPVLILEIYARNIEYQVSSSPSLTFEVTKGSELVLWSPTVPSNLSLRLKYPDSTTQDVAPQVLQGYFGIFFSFRTGQLNTEQMEAPDVSLETFDYLSRIRDDGTVAEMGFLNE